ncbi:MAG: heavy metal translocating P-type ATPase [Micrococcus sp.]|nr:heavy metal translocating P-type ATPase [Micrococcus sp.]MDY6054994.1 heavy metal translocating P-type ATPase [Micrococcus sp.]
MTCASCVGRVERKLGRIDGVTASVNLPLERATVQVPEGVSDEQIVATVQKAGYGATVRRPASAPAGPEGPENPDTGHGAGDAHEDHDGHGAGEQDHLAHGPREAVLRPRLIVAALLTVPLVLISMVPALWFPHWGWAAFALATPVVLWCAWPFHAAAARAGRHGSSTMDTLVSVGVLVAWGYSAVELILDPGMTAHAGMEGMGGMADMADHSLYFETAAVITTFLLLGRFLEARAKREAGAALRALLDLGADQATLHDPSTGAERTVPAASLQVGDVVVIRPGEKVPTDAVVVDGRSAVDASLLTGESVPEEVGPGDEITGATLNTSGRLIARATRVGSETTLARMGRLVADAQTGKARVARLADRISAVFVPIVLVVAVLTFVGWMLATGGDLAAALRAGVAVLVIACPCALGLATPVGLLAGTGRASQLGILIRGPEVLEDSRTVDTIVLDKTGTVTEGRMRLASITPVDETGGEASAPVDETGGSEGAPVYETEGPASAPVDETGGSTAATSRFSNESAPETSRFSNESTPATSRFSNESGPLVLAAAVEAGSEHPIARAIVDAAHERGLDVPSVQDFSSTAGGGVRGTVAHDGRPHRVLVGRTSLLEAELGPDALTTAHRAMLAEAEQAGATAVWVAVDGAPAAILSVQDTVKPTSTAAIARLKELGLRPLLVTGDNAAVATQVGDAVGIAPEDVIAGVRPEDKVDVVRRLQGEGAVVAMVGDGVNDAPALAAADVGIAMGSGTDVAREAAQITVMGSDLDQVVQALDLSRRTLHIIRTNLFWAFAYNTLGIPVAAAGLLNPMIAGGAMAASSVLVVLNSLRLTRYAR